MSASSPTGKVLLLIDDDLLSREVLMLLATVEGFSVHAEDSGLAALKNLSSPGGSCPDVVLVDMQMPGLAGDALAKQLRASCGPAAVLLAMSGSPVAVSSRLQFDSFLLKPFSMPDLHAAIARAHASQPGKDQRNVKQVPRELPPTLNESVFASLSEGMPAAQLLELYNMCLDDAERRLESMRKASVERDRAAFLSGAHAIKGGCGMVGATELAAMAAHMEVAGLPPVGEQAPFDDFVAAAQRLRRMLDAQSKHSLLSS